MADGGSLLAKVHDLKALLDEGLLSSAEFDEERAALLRSHRAFADAAPTGRTLGSADEAEPPAPRQPAQAPLPRPRPGAARAASPQVDVRHRATGSTVRLASSPLAHASNEELDELSLLLSDNEAEVRRLDGELHGASGDARLHLQQQRRVAQTARQALVRRHSALMGPSGSASALSASREQHGVASRQSPPMPTSVALSERPTRHGTGSPVSPASPVSPTIRSSRRNLMLSPTRSAATSTPSARSSRRRQLEDRSLQTDRTPLGTPASRAHRSPVQVTQLAAEHARVIEHRAVPRSPLPRGAELAAATPLPATPSGWADSPEEPQRVAVGPQSELEQTLERHRQSQENVSSAIKAMGRVHAAATAASVPARRAPATDYAHSLTTVRNRIYGNGFQDGRETVMSPDGQPVAWRARTPEFGAPRTAMSASPYRRPDFGTSDTDATLQPPQLIPQQQQADGSPLHAQQLEDYARSAREEAQLLEEEALQLQFRATAAAAEEVQRKREENARVSEADAAEKIAAMLRQKEGDARRLVAVASEQRQAFEEHAARLDGRRVGASPVVLQRARSPQLVPARRLTMRSPDLLPRMARSPTLVPAQPTPDLLNDGAVDFSSDATADDRRGARTPSPISQTRVWEEKESQLRAMQQQVAAQQQALVAQQQAAEANMQAQADRAALLMQQQLEALLAAKVSPAQFSPSVHADDGSVALSAEAYGKLSAYFAKYQDLIPQGELTNIELSNVGLVTARNSPPRPQQVRQPEPEPEPEPVPVTQKKAKLMIAETRRCPELRAGLVALIRDGRLQTAFKLWDKDRDNLLSESELREGLQGLLGQGVSAEQVSAMFQSGGAGDLSMPEFLQVLTVLDSSLRMAKKVAHKFHGELQDMSASLQEAFEGFGTNGDGVLSRQELVKGLRSIGIDMSTSDERELMSLLDTDGDGEIDVGEFVSEFKVNMRGILPTTSQAAPAQLAAVLATLESSAKPDELSGVLLADPYGQAKVSWYIGTRRATDSDYVGICRADDSSKNCGSDYVYNGSGSAAGELAVNLSEHSKGCQYIACYYWSIDEVLVMQSQPFVMGAAVDVVDQLQDALTAPPRGSSPVAFAVDESPDTNNLFDWDEEEEEEEEEKMTDVDEPPPVKRGGERKKPTFGVMVDTSGSGPDSLGSNPPSTTRGSTPTLLSGGRPVEKSGKKKFGLQVDTSDGGSGMDSPTSISPPTTSIALGPTTPSTSDAQEHWVAGAFIASSAEPEIVVKWALNGREATEDDYLGVCKAKASGGYAVADALIDEYSTDELGQAQDKGEKTLELFDFDQGTEYVVCYFADDSVIAKSDAFTRQSGGGGSDDGSLVLTPVGRVSPRARNDERNAHLKLEAIEDADDETGSSSPTPRDDPDDRSSRGLGVPEQEGLSLSTSLATREQESKQAELRRLKAECKAVNLPSGGLIAELRERLGSHRAVLDKSGGGGSSTASSPSSFATAESLDMWSDAEGSGDDRPKDRRVTFSSTQRTKALGMQMGDTVLLLPGYKAVTIIQLYEDTPAGTQQMVDIRLGNGREQIVTMDKLQRRDEEEDDSDVEQLPARRKAGSPPVRAGLMTPKSTSGSQQARSSTPPTSPRSEDAIRAAGSVASLKEQIRASGGSPPPELIQALMTAQMAAQGDSLLGAGPSNRDKVTEKLREFLGDVHIGGRGGQGTFEGSYGPVIDFALRSGDVMCSRSAEDIYAAYTEDKVRNSPAPFGPQGTYDDERGADEGEEAGWLLIEGLEETERATAKPFQPLGSDHGGFPAWESSGAADLFIYSNNGKWTVGRQLGKNVVATSSDTPGKRTPVGDADWKVYNAAYRTWNEVDVRVFELGPCRDVGEAATEIASHRAKPPMPSRRPQEPDEAAESGDRAGTPERSGGLFGSNMLGRFRTPTPEKQRARATTPDQQQRQPWHSPDQQQHQAESPPPPVKASRFSSPFRSSTPDKQQAGQPRKKVFGLF